MSEVEAAINEFDGVEWSSSGYPLPGYPLPRLKGDPVNAGWVKFRLQQSPIGWRTLEFLAWLFTDMIRAGERIEFFPTSSPPYLNTPGECLSFVIEIYPLDGDQDERFHNVAEFMNMCLKEYWPECCKDFNSTVK